MSNKSKKEGIAELVEGLGHYKLECKKQAKDLKRVTKVNKALAGRVQNLEQKTIRQEGKIGALSLRNNRLLEALKEGSTLETQKEIVHAILKEMQEEAEAEEKNNSSCCPNHLSIIEFMQRFKPEN